jgi:hypothetical protein
MNNQYLPDYPWSIIKSYMLTLDKSRKTKTAKLMRPLCDEYNDVLKMPVMIGIPNYNKTFHSIYFAFLHQRRSNFNYSRPPIFSQQSLDFLNNF